MWKDNLETNLMRFLETPEIGKNLQNSYSKRDRRTDTVQIRQAPRKSFYTAMYWQKSLGGYTHRHLDWGLYHTTRTERRVHLSYICLNIDTVCSAGYSVNLTIRESLRDIRRTDGKVERVCPGMQVRNRHHGITDTDDNKRGRNIEIEDYRLGGTSPTIIGNLGRLSFRLWFNHAWGVTQS